MIEIAFYHNGEPYAYATVGHVDDISAAIRNRFIDMIPTGYTVVITQIDDD